MDTLNADYSSNMLHEYVFEGFWNNPNKSPLQQWIWTLTNLQALLVFAFLALFFAFTQSRIWVILRHFVFVRKRSIRLDGDVQQDPFTTLSQGSALETLMSFLTHYIAKVAVPLQTTTAKLYPRYLDLRRFSM